MLIILWRFITTNHASDITAISYILFYSRFKAKHINYNINMPASNRLKFKKSLYSLKHLRLHFEKDVVIERTSDWTMFKWRHPVQSNNLFFTQFCISYREPLEQQCWQPEITRYRRNQQRTFSTTEEKYSLHVWRINKRIGFNTLRFVYGALVALSGRLSSLPLCFLEYLEWVLYETAYLKRTWGTLGSPQQLPSCAPCRTPPLQPPISQVPLTTRITHRSLDITAEMCTTSPEATVQL